MAFDPKSFFNDTEKEEIVKRIREAERLTSGEIRVHVDGAPSGDVLGRARRIFEKIGMAKTRERNGVLIYINAVKKRFAIIGDYGIHTYAGNTFWQSLSEEMERDFKAGDYLGGLLNTIESIGRGLREAFPRKKDDTNEIPDDISYGEGK